MAKSQVKVTSRADSAKTRNAALARRLASGNIHDAGTRALPLKEPHRWHTYIANTYLDESEFYRMKERGWIPLEVDDLACPVEESGFVLSTDGYLVRGPQGKEMVFKMAAEDYRLLQEMKTAANLRAAGIGSASAAKSRIANATGAALGSEAGDYINSLDGQVIDSITGGDAA